MSNQLSPSEMRRYALAGAEARLVQISQEAETIRRAFPELGGNGTGGNGVHGAPNPRTADENNSDKPSRGRQRRSMSAAQRKAVAERMKKYWAARRSASEGGRGQTPPTSTFKGAQKGTTSGAKTAKSPATRGPRTMSPAARKRISEAQKKRWAKQRQAA